MTIQRIIDRTVVDSNGCWVWQGPLYFGYGRIWDPVSRKMVRAHRYAYECVNGELEHDDLVRHLCPNGHNTSCCNPKHLAAGNSVQNHWDSREKYEESYRKRSRSGGWNIDGTIYSSIAKASEGSGIPKSFLEKFCTDGVFDRNSYENRRTDKGDRPLETGWTVYGVRYRNLIEASDGSGISRQLLCNYTVDGIFNHELFERNHPRARRLRYSV